MIVKKRIPKLLSLQGHSWECTNQNPVETIPMCTLYEKSAQDISTIQSIKICSTFEEPSPLAPILIILMISKKKQYIQHSFPRSFLSKVPGLVTSLRLGAHREQIASLRELQRTRSNVSLAFFTPLPHFTHLKLLCEDVFSLVGKLVETNGTFGTQAKN